MIRIVNCDLDGKFLGTLELDDVAGVLTSQDKLLWVDIFNSPYEESLHVLRDIFGFHPLSIDDALVETHVPKIDDWGEYLYLVCKVINPGYDMETELITQEVDIFIGKNYILTYHQNRSETIDKVWNKCQTQNEKHKSRPANILYLLLDETASDFISSTDQMELTLNDLEDQLFDNPDPSLLENIFTLKRSILRLRKSIGPQREVLNRLARGDYSVIKQQSFMYFRDVYDHFLRLYEITENLRDLTGNTLEIFLSVVNNRMNGIMKTLTIITTLFMPISFLAGFFGMNFFAPVENYTGWTSEPILIAVLIGSILFPIGMILYFNRKGWMK